MKKLFSLLIGILVTISSFATLPSKVYAPYVDVMLWPTFSLMNCYNATGQKYYTLAFITANGTQPAWGGVTPMSDNFMLDQIQQLRAVGGDVIVSFGGANGTPIDANITDVTTLVNTYSSVIDRYGLTWIDFDIEGFWVADQASIDRRNAAAKQLQAKYPGLRITYCLPVMPTGLTSDGVNIINKAKAAGVNVYSVNVMAMDYGGANSAMGQAAISAAQATRSQTGLNIGITPMIGQNDSAGEIFSLSNASEVLNFANANAYVNMLAMWSANRDNGGCAGQTYASPTCSGLSQSSFAFVNAFKSFSGGTSNPPPSVSITSPSNGATYTAPASITINANASDNGSVTQVQFYNGSTLLGTDTSSPYSYSWTNVAAGTYSITAKATDDQGATTTSSAVSVTVNGTSGAAIPGTIQAENWTAMSGVQTETTTDTGGGLNVGWIEAGDWMDYNVSIATTGSYNVAFRVASSPGGGQLQLRQGSTTLATVNIAATGGWQTWVTLNATVNLTAGSTTLRVYAGASGWNINWMQFTSNTSNPPPTVSITSPSNGASFTAPASITINATASDNGSVTQVQFYNGSTLLGTDTSSPYSYSWTNVAAGTYSLTARATDNQGATTTSSAVSVTVTSSTGSCSGVAQYVENGGYVAGSRVKNVGNQYECKPYPYSGWCNGAAWAYAPGTGTYWTDAWTLVGACTARMATEDINANEIILETDGMVVSPNPSKGNGSVTLTFDRKIGDAEVHFIHLNGMQIHSSHHANVGRTLEVNVPAVPAGIYMIKVRGNQQTFTKKVVLE